MRKLFLFLYRYRAFGFFLLLEALCGWLIVENNSYQGAAFFNSSNRLVASVLNTSDKVSGYFDLAEENKRLMSENLQLKKLLLNTDDGLEQFYLDSLVARDTTIVYEFENAKVINNSNRRLHNFITLNKGSNDGIAAGMGVVGPDGIVGMVRDASRHFSTVVSALHTDFLISSHIKRTNTFCTTNWDGRNPAYANLLYIPRHVDIQKGDTVLTSGYNSVFPPEVMVGVVDEVSISENATFYNAKLRLSTDFSSLSYVAVVKHSLKLEKDSLQVNSTLVNE